ncbi:MAG: hypothetical protein LZF86_120060 [Nitrospira sp.]|nr:MAG: hypothetical protein LZF86_120060 [Nitrospira sp.]
MMAASLYLLREPLEGIESSLFAPLDAESAFLIEGGLPSSSKSFAEIVQKSDRKEVSSQSSVTEAELLELVFAHGKVIVL